MAPIQQSTLTRLSFNRASRPTEISKITHMGRAQHVFKCFAGSGPVTVNTMLSPAWEPSRMHTHTPANCEYYSLVYLGICMWEVKTIPAVCLHCMGHPKHHSNTNCLNLIGGGGEGGEREDNIFLFVSLRRKKAFHQLLCLLKVVLQVTSRISVIIHQALTAWPVPEEITNLECGDDSSLGINCRSPLFLASREYMANCSWDGLCIYKGESESYLELKITQKHKGM